MQWQINLSLYKIVKKVIVKLENRNNNIKGLLRRWKLSLKEKKIGISVLYVWMREGNECIQLVNIIIVLKSIILSEILFNIKIVF